ncbi:MULTISPECIES: sensor histidine kinase [Kribbella]|uniref:Anti-sigma regulatory factor (Ser/Thr protein kinase) n=1 Tax=Kribbella pratensis TaxID=2512112 RepID=A0ABY2F5G0_9ACTN|nr:MULTISPECIES: sensor histidine kinase [Kribbella]TDW81733.1 anti-sigma regulatory factor (Ser/Thr protein kinase) [Kribbella pratensis]TDW83443.1 anti-sigma regulatory factor (Ser/Thr protein kinase) [Kribbella sp. VKM Ac-2566]
MLKDSATDSLHGAPAGFLHDAFVHVSDEEFVQRSAAFMQDGLAAGETIVAVLPPERIAVLRDALGPIHHEVCFTDMTVAGGNPARLIPYWRSVIEQHPGPVRGLSEPAYPGRSAAAYDEVLLHEALSDIAFAQDRAFRLYCAYQASVGIDPTVTHSGAEALAEKEFRTALDDVPDRAERWEFGPGELGQVRQWLSGQAASHGVSRDRLEDLSLALHEICTNSIRFGGGRGRLAVWIADGTLICDVRDCGRIDDLLVGRVLPPLDGLGGRGVWLANQLCDLAQLRSGDDFTQVRLHTRLR